MMSNLKLLFGGIGFLVFCYSQLNNNNGGENIEKTTRLAIERKELQKLIYQLYTWHGMEDGNVEFKLMKDPEDHQYTGLDFSFHMSRLNKYKYTDFFTEEFLANYHKIALTIDKMLKEKEEEKLIGELSFLENDAALWCKQEDTPLNYWECMIIEDIEITNNTASFVWTWNNQVESDFKYRVIAVKENDIWKITYMEGFDYETLFPAPEITQMI